MRARHHVGDDLGVGRIRDGRLEHADHRGTARAERDGPADDRGIAVERRGPEALGQHHDARRIRPIVGGVEQAAEHGAKAHHLEVRAADHAGLHHAGLAESEEGEIDGREIAEVRDRGRARLEVVDLRHRERRVRGAEARRALADVDEPILAAIDERPQQHAADHAEDGGVGADAERECRHHGDGQPPGAPERAQADTHVLQQGEGGVEPAAVPDAVHRVADGGDVAELAQRRQAGGLRVRAAVNMLFRAERQMTADLLVELALVRAHGYSLLGTGFITRPIAFTSCDHRSRSRDSCALPVAVSW